MTKNVRNEADLTEGGKLIASLAAIARYWRRAARAATRHALAHAADLRAAVCDPSLAPEQRDARAWYLAGLFVAAREEARGYRERANQCEDRILAYWLATVRLFTRHPLQTVGASPLAQWLEVARSRGLVTRKRKTVDEARSYAFCTLTDAGRAFLARFPEIA